MEWVSFARRKSSQHSGEAEEKSRGKHRKWNWEIAHRAWMYAVYAWNGNERAIDAKMDFQFKNGIRCSELISTESSIIAGVSREYWIHKSAVDSDRITHNHFILAGKSQLNRALIVSLPDCSFIDELLNADKYWLETSECKYFRLQWLFIDFDGGVREKP